MNADDEKKLHDLLRVARPLGATNAGETAIMKALIGAFALGRARGLTEAAGIASTCSHNNELTIGERAVLLNCKVAIEQARDK